MKRLGVWLSLLALASISRATTITQLAVTAQSGTTITIQWTTDVASNSRLLYGQGNTNSATPVLAPLVTSHTLVLSGVAPGSNYSYAAQSTDAYGNVATSATQQFTICDPSSASPGLTNASGSINNYYEYGSSTFTWVNTSGYGVSPTLCGQALTTTYTGHLDGGASFNSQLPDTNQIVPSPSQWSLRVAGVDNSIGAITVQQAITPQGNNLSSPLRAAAVGQLIHVWYDPATGTYYPAAGGGGSVSGLTAGFLPIAGSSTTITGNSHIDDGVTTAAALTSTEPLAFLSAGASATVGASPTGGLLRLNGPNLTVSPAGLMVLTNAGSFVTPNTYSSASQVLINGGNPYSIYGHFTGPGTVQDGFSCADLVPSSSTAYQNDCITGYMENHSTAGIQTATSGYSVNLAIGGGAIQSGNFAVIDSPTTPAAGMAAIEADMQPYAPYSAYQALPQFNNLNYSDILAVYYSPYPTVLGQAIQIASPQNTHNEGVTYSGAHFSAGIRIREAATGTAVVIEPSCDVTTSPCDGQPVLLEAYGPTAGTMQNSYFLATAQGDLQFQPAVDAKFNKVTIFSPNVSSPGFYVIPSDDLATNYAAYQTNHANSAVVAGWYNSGDWFSKSLTTTGMNIFTPSIAGNSAFLIVPSDDSPSTYAWYQSNHANTTRVAGAYDTGDWFARSITTSSTSIFAPVTAGAAGLYIKASDSSSSTAAFYVANTAGTSILASIKDDGSFVFPTGVVTAGLTAASLAGSAVALGNSTGTIYLTASALQMNGNAGLTQSCVSNIQLLNGVTIGCPTTLFTPASSSAACTAGTFADDTGYHYVCVAANTWKRVALTTF